MANAKKAKVLTLIHRDGSRKSKIHAIFDKSGPEVAFKTGVRLKLRETTLRSWFSQFRKCVAPKKATRAKRAA